MKIAVIIATVAILLGGIFGNFLRFSERMPDHPPELGKIPYSAGNYYGDERRFAEASYEVLKADTTTLRRYVDSDGTIYWLFVAYFSSQKYGSQIHSPKQCLPGGGWKIQKLEPFTFPFPNGIKKEINRVTINAPGSSQEVMFYWFETRTGSIRDEFAIKWDLMKNSLLLRPTDAAFIRLTLPLGEGGLPEATEKAVRFFDTFYMSIERSLPFGN